MKCNVIFRFITLTCCVEVMENIMNRKLDSPRTYRPRRHHGNCCTCRTCRLVPSPSVASGHLWWCSGGRTGYWRCGRSHLWETHKSEQSQVVFVCLKGRGVKHKAKKKARQGGSIWPKFITRVQRFPLEVPSVVELGVEGPALLLSEAPPRSRTFLRNRKTPSQLTTQMVSAR